MAQLVTIFGGDGFVGTQIVQELAHKGYRIRVAVRRPDLSGHLKPLGSVGQIAPIQANVRNKESVQRAVAGADIVINLVGIAAEGGRQRFRAVHTMGAKNVAEAATEAGVPTLVHMSALGADPESESAYSQSKGLGEQEVLKAFPKAVIMRPSVIFGTDDTFFNLFGWMSRVSPVLPVVGAKSRFQPVFVGDVAAAFVKAAEGGAKPGKIYELGGVEVETMRELMARLLRVANRTNMLLPLPKGIAKIVGWFTQILPRPILTVDQVIQMQSDNVVSDAAKKQKRTLGGLGITPTSMDAILSTYVWRFRKHGQFEKIEA